jgi:hypothetical protein
LKSFSLQQSPNLGGSVSMNETQHFCTKSESPICKHFGCVNVMRKMRRQMIVSYARVSTDGQTPDAPYAALAAAEKVFAEKTSEARCCAKARAGFRSLADA